jgi:ribosome-binding protein aMBF1 (putative translation factor)
MDGQRLTNRDAAYLELPPCKLCGAENRPGIVYLEIVGAELVCRVCGKSEKRIDEAYQPPYATKDFTSGPSRSR